MPVPSRSRLDHGKSAFRISAEATAVHGHPAEFGTGVGRVIELEAGSLGLGDDRNKALEYDRAADARPRRVIRRHPVSELADRFRNVGAEEHQLVLVRVGQAELEIGLAEPADPLARFADGGLDLADALDQVPEGLIAERQHHLFLVLEIEIQRGRGHPDPVRDPADGRGPRSPVPGTAPWRPGGFPRGAYGLRRASSGRPSPLSKKRSLGFSCP